MSDSESSPPRDGPGRLSREEIDELVTRTVEEELERLEDEEL